MKPLLIPIGAMAVLLAGCAGHNSTLFMTKSNVGLDFDSKPPTLEVNISRKEAVIAPSFEGGKTPPVLASFKPGVGAGGSFGSFFLGVDQTFAGGDAALAMAKLYNQPTATDRSQFNSELELSEAPKYTGPFRRVAGAGETRPLIFGTDTSLGLKAAWSGAGGQVPDTVKLGFNRKEFAWAPLNSTPKVKQDGSKDGTKVNVKMPAFLATVESSQQVVSNSAKTEALQYFATGESATYLAMQKDVRAAMHARLDPNSQAYKARFGTQGLNVLSDILFSLETILTRFADSKDEAARGLLNRLNSLSGLGMPSQVGTAEVPVFRFDAVNKILKKNEGAQQNLGQSLSDVTSYLSTLQASQAHITTALQQIGPTGKVKLAVGNQAANDVTADTLAIEFSSLKERSDKLKAALAADQTVNAAHDYVQAMISKQR